MNREWAFGTFVWAKMNKKFWPGIVVNPKDISFEDIKDNSSLIFWFGEHSVSPITNSNIIDFCENFNDKCKTYGASKSWISAVVEALKIIGESNDVYVNEKELISWAKLNIKSVRRNNSDIPHFVKEKLLSLFFDKEDQGNANYTKKRKSLGVKQIIERYRSNETDSLEICMGCYSKEITNNHPIFHGKICNTCTIHIKERYYIIGTDQIKYCCVICSCLGKVAVCDRPGCRFVYCFTCIDEFASYGAREEILRNQNWHCFICDNTSKLRGTLLLRENWKQNITNLFGLEKCPPAPPTKRRIRVLSLFDGIGSGLTSLINLKISIEEYYTSEIDVDSIDVVEKNYPSGTTLLGDILSLNQNQLKSILPIDLLMGGSPCNDLSRANPNRRGLWDSDGTGILFFEFFRILSFIKLHNEGRHLFWLFENVTSMSPESKQIITRFLECEPMIIDAGWVTPMRRPRLFWGNLPSIAHQEIIDDGPLLQSVLLPGRTANVDKLQTVTTKSNSLLQGPKCKLPVIDKNGQEDYLHITELEAVFGFPRNYTDINNFSFSKRLKLIGKAWSVPVIMMLLSCLKDYYAACDH
ncbi:DNA (cytosine-5)-methyltransferase 3A-like [Onthophagus taurus]|uniref:DNA (cytosine-5)-methyltransferase 3A-like n=1 Tax=Onthophagus taurus TaxID=166361 RepID=UPI000C20AC60|nr:DNA (cytosine-5)-methyltransferase 3A-like [Onthophagus taurus]